MYHRVPVGTLFSMAFIFYRGLVMKFWRTLKGGLMVTFPYIVSVGTGQGWGFSYKRHNLVLTPDTTTPYSLLHVGPYEFLIRPKSHEIDWF